MSIIYSYDDSSISVFGWGHFKIDESGNIESNYKGLKLWNDSIKANWSVGGLGCGANYYYVGRRISKKP